MVNRPPPWARSLRTGSGSTICTVTCGSGLRTVGTFHKRVRRRMEPPGFKVIVRCAFCAAAPGATSPGTSVPRTASGSPTFFGTSASVSGWPGRSTASSWGAQRHRVQRRASRESHDEKCAGPSCLARRGRDGAFSIPSSTARFSRQSPFFLHGPPRDVSIECPAHQQDRVFDSA